MVFAARLTQRGQTISCMDDLLALYEQSFTDNTAAAIASLPHPTVQKFAVLTVAIVGASRRFLAQITRHQNEVKFMSASLQYSNYSGQADFAVPYEILTASESIRRLYLESCQSDMSCYEQLCNAGIGHDAAGYATPQGLRNVLIISATPYQWKHKAGEDNLIIAKDTHEPIISHALFNAVREYRRTVCEESKAKPKNPYTPNIFKGKVFCADCGRSLHRQRAERKKGPDTYWFHCLTNSRIAKGSCNGVMIQETELIATVTSILEKELTVALGMSLPLFQLEARQKLEKDTLRAAMSVKRQEIEKKQRLIRGLYENFVQGILTSEEYFDMKANYEMVISTLSGEIEQLENGMGALDGQLDKYREMEQDAKLLAQDHALTAELIERLIDRIEIDYERNIHVRFRFKNEFQGKAVAPCSDM